MRPGRFSIVLIRLSLEVRGVRKTRLPFDELEEPLLDLALRRRLDLEVLLRPLFLAWSATRF